MKWMREARSAIELAETREVDTELEESAIDADEKLKLFCPYVIHINVYTEFERLRCDRCAKRRMTFVKLHLFE
jgi:hypothetical protein